MIDGPVSGRWAVVEAQLFLARLDPKGPEMESYLLSLMEPLSALTEALDPVGLPLGPPVQLADQLAEARTAGGALAGLPPLRRTEVALRRRAALLYAYAGSMKKALRQLVKCDGVPDDLSESVRAARGPKNGGESSGRVSPHRRLQKMRQEEKREGLELELEWLLDHWALTPPEEERGHGAWVPVVERLPAWARGTRERSDPCSHEVGALRRVLVDLRGAVATSPGGDASVSADEDRLWTGGALHANSKSVVEEPLAAARAWIDREHPTLRGRYLEGRLAFDWACLRREGRSAGLPIASLFYTSALEEAGHRQRLVLRPDAAFTGAVSSGSGPGPPRQKSPNREGEAVRPVSEQGLSIKVRTAFFSPQETLAVPAAQEAQARRILDRLRDRHPHGALDVVGVSELRDVMNHRRLTTRIETGWLRYAARCLRARRGSVFAGTVIAVLVLALGVLLYGPLDKTPATADFEGEQMIVKNAGGSAIERISVGAKVVRRANDPTRRYRAFAFHDVTGDGRKEICWGQNTPQSDDRDFVACKEVGANEPLWHFSLDSLAAPFPNKPAVRAGQYTASGMTIGDFTGDDRPEVYVTTAHQPYFPSLFLQLDARTGEEMGRYLHPGHFKVGPVPVDLDGDGPEELLIGGHTNAYDQAALAVLDPDRVEGHGPVTPEYAVSGHDRATERTYLRFPRTKVGAAQGNGISMVRRIRVREGGRIEVQVREGYVGSSEQRGEAYILVCFDRSLRPESVGTSSQYDRLADTLAQRGTIGEVPDADYFESYQGHLRYWTGGKWQAENKR